MTGLLRSRFLVVTVIALLVISVLPLMVFAFVGLEIYRDRDEAYNKNEEAYQAQSQEIESFARTQVQLSSDIAFETKLETLETLATTTALQIASFLREREGDLHRLALEMPSEAAYLNFVNFHRRQVWIVDGASGKETYIDLPLYREISFLNAQGQAQFTIGTVCESYPLGCEVQTLHDSESLAQHYSVIRREDLFDIAIGLQRDEVFVSRPIGYYVPFQQAFRGADLPNGRRFEGVVRFITPVYDPNTDARLGYLVLALDQTHLIEFISHIDPTSTRPLGLVDVSAANFAYIVGSDGGTIADIRHGSIVGVDVVTGEPVPAFNSADQLISAPANLNEMGFLNPIFPQIMERALVRAQGVVERYEVLQQPRALAYAVIPYRAQPHYTDARGFGLVIVQADYNNLRIESTLITRQVEEFDADVNLSALPGQVSWVIFVVIVLVGTASVVVAQAVLTPIRHITRYSQVMERRGLTNEEVTILKNKKGKDEISQLARTFGSMAETVRAREQQIAELLLQTDEALNRRVVELSALEKVGRQLTSNLNLASLLDFATHVVLENTAARRVELVIFAQSDEDTAPYRVVAGEAKSEATAETIFVPLELEGKTIGQFTLAAQTQPFAESQQSFVRQLADWLSVAVRNARLFAHIQEQQRQLEATNAQVVEANRLKSEFIANISHELRTPLNAIIGFSDMLMMGMSGTLNEKQEHRITRIRDNGKRLLELVNDILDLSRIEAGRLEIYDAPFSPRELIDRLTSQMVVLAEKKKLDFYYEIDENLAPVLIGDEKRIEQVIANLLSNAFKFTETGSVTLKVKVDNQARSWVVSVTDTGIGIAPHAQEYIFEAFRQVDGSTTRAYQGTGLGLAITRNLLRLMGGKVTVQSTVGQGSTFVIVLPLIEPEKVEEKS